MDYEIIGGNTSPTIKDLNQKAIKTLYDLLDNLSPDGKNDPDMVTAVTDAIAKLNTSLRNSGILPQDESEAEKREKLSAQAIKEVLQGE
jgi:hypothetical protein